MLSVKNQEWLNETIKKIITKLEAVSERSKYKIPYTTLNGVHDDFTNSHMENHKSEGINWWTNGFWGGLMWLMYSETKDKKYKKIAEFSEEKLDKCFEEYYKLHHDVGFMWLLTSIANYCLTKNEDGKRRGLHAANILAGRFNPNGNFIRAWNENGDNDVRGWAIIDCMMNIPLLYWAYDETNDPRFYQIAIKHANKVVENFIRPDGSSEHIVEFNPETGEKVSIHGGQGYCDGSSWTRGQAWALYGFIISYIHTKNSLYLNTAKQVAHYFISNIPKSNIIPIDFRQPSKVYLEDSTAAVIAACGLIEISKNVNKLEKDLYLNSAIRILKTISEKRCDWSLKTDGLLKYCSESYHFGSQHINIIYGDYFFVEAILKLKGNTIFFW
jgi:unsaturated chondroitin disaccharide hydrolase